MNDSDEILEGTSFDLVGYNFDAVWRDFWRLFKLDIRYTNDSNAQ